LRFEVAFRFRVTFVVAGPVKHLVAGAERPVFQLPEMVPYISLTLTPLDSLEVHGKERKEIGF